jgi:hypothetical protein
MLGVLPFNTTRTYNGDGQVVVREANGDPQRWIWNGQNILHETNDAGVTACLYTREPCSNLNRSNTAPTLPIEQ